MPPEASRYAADWLRIAQKDFARVEHLLSVEDAEAAGFYLQQAVEKFLKAFLIASGWRLERVHDLEVLLNAAIAYDRSLEPFREVCQKITGFYFIERYPDVAGESLAEDDVRRAMEQVRTLIETVKAKMAH
jgi:HEPN domain-containing protein